MIQIKFPDIVKMQDIVKIHKTYKYQTQCNFLTFLTIGFFNYRVSKRKRVAKNRLPFLQYVATFFEELLNPIFTFILFSLVIYITNEHVVFFWVYFAKKVIYLQWIGFMIESSLETFLISKTCWSVISTKFLCNFDCFFATFNTLHSLMFRI